MKTEILHDDSTAFIYVFKQDGTHLSEGKHVLLNYKDVEVFKGTYNDCVDYFNTHKSEVLHPNHPQLKTLPITG